MIYPELVDQPEQQMPDSSNQEIILPQSPAKRLKQISALENCCGKRGDCYCCFYVLTVMGTNISGAEKKSRQYKQKSMIKARKRV